MIPAIAVQNVTISYERTPVLRAVTVAIPPKQIVGIIGPNGAGKSTLLKGIIGLLPLDSGQITIFSKPIAQSRDKLAYVPQRTEIDWHFPVTVRDVVLMGRYKHLGWLQRPKKADKDITQQALQQMGMTEFAERAIDELSGGQQQRVFLARALAQQADILLLDEPFVGVDAATENAIWELLHALKADGKTILVVNHDLTNMVKRYDQLVLLNQRLVASGSPAEVFTPAIINKAYGGLLTLLEEVRP